MFFSSSLSLSWSSFTFPEKKKKRKEESIRSQTSNTGHKKQSAQCLHREFLQDNELSLTQFS